MGISPFLQECFGPLSPAGVASPFAGSGQVFKKAADCQDLRKRILKFKAWPENKQGEVGMADPQSTSPQVPLDDAPARRLTTFLS
jgi:hypothetical protein